jgi:hypothetical protein
MAATCAPWIAAVLRAEPAAVERLMRQPEFFCEAADAHGALGLVARSLRRSDVFGQLPEVCREQLLITVRREQGLELARRTELIGTLAAFDAAGIPALVFKGAALAYTHYPHPHLRPRLDTDLLVHETHRDASATVLRALRYHQKAAVSRDAIFTQATFYRDSIGNFRHLVDLHWRIANRPLFRDLLSFDELAADAVAVESLGSSPRTPCPIHSLLLACLHPVAHHHCEWPLIWLYDISLLAESLSGSDWSRLREIAIEKKVSLICKRAFQLVEDCFGRQPWIVESRMLDISDDVAADEPSARYLTSEFSAGRDLLLDLSASRGLRAKGRLLLSHAFPDLHYMREIRGASCVGGIVAAYGRRLTNAAARLLHLHHSPRPAGSELEG